MGADIHCYIEYKKPDNEVWSDFGSRINPGRFYGAFARMAGVRNYWEQDGIKAICKPRGMPADAAYEARGDNELYVVERKEGDVDAGEGRCFIDRAENWVKSGCSAWVEHNGLKKWVTQPDWHSHSWLTPDEFAACIKDLNEAMEYVAILACLRSFEQQGCEARLVFWFDN